MITIRTTFSLLAIWATSAVAQASGLTRAESRFEFRSPTISYRLDDSMPQFWPDQQEPADSLWRQAREQLNRGDYRRAAALFKDLGQKSSNSAYAAEAPYWQAFALSRIGGTTELQEALALLSPVRE